MSDGNENVVKENGTGEGDALAGAATEPTIESVTAERDALADKLAAMTAERDALKAAAAKADTAPRAKAGAAKARKVGPVKGTGPLDDDGRRSLLKMIQEAGEVEIAFSDGKAEIAGMPPAVIAGNAWRIGVAGLVLRDVGIVRHGPAHGAPHFHLAGYGLMLDGEQIAWSARDKPLLIAPGTAQGLADDIVF